jgi:hypothetical protein
MYRDDETAARLWEAAAEKRVAELELRRLAAGLWRLHEDLQEKSELLAALRHDLQTLRDAARPERRNLRVLGFAVAVFVSTFLPLLAFIAC